MSTVWSAIGDKKEKWRRIFKGLNLLDYLLKFGSERVGKIGLKSIILWTPHGSRVAELSVSLHRA